MKLETKIVTGFLVTLVGLNFVFGHMFPPSQARKDAQEQERVERDRQSEIDKECREKLKVLNERVDNDPHSSKEVKEAVKADWANDCD